MSIFWGGGFVVHKLILQLNIKLKETGEKINLQGGNSIFFLNLNHALAKVKIPSK